ncbi:hypothetical protein SAMN00777080_2451 [Aquiflexum balticum DSM 16537]|uniref:Uncharacterized protein n=1 Tax=Aquiflexum balticum DSM 16537 TaxID=758820 RepID=A0A1W2H4M2_9BACT|nr:hypothetical protein [Aquiflexum balticum]SMD43839.1 hypothetical protein SAMN00777080_2451 [Aquiflexum balticum DSM 16537]
MKKLPFLAGIFGLFYICSCQSEIEGPQQDQNSTVVLSKGTEVQDAQGNTFKIGYDQVSSINQDPFILKTKPNGETVWRIKYEETPVDGRGTVIAFEEGKLLAVFTVDGGSNDGKYLNKHQVWEGAFDGVFQSGYEKGGGPKVSAICEIDPETGKIKKGSFVAARLTNGNTNSLTIREIGVNKGKIAFRVSAAAWPPGVGSKYVRMPYITDADRIDNAFLIYYEMEADFSAIRKATLLRESF